MEEDLGHFFEKFPNRKREDLIPLLQAIQDEEGYLSEKIISAVGRYLDISTNKIYGVATFYDNFRFTASGKYHFRVCHGSACHVTGTGMLVRELEKQLKVKDGETDKEGLFSLELVSCIGACGLAPVIAVNDQYYTNVTLDSLKNLIESFREIENSAI